VVKYVLLELAAESAVELAAALAAADFSPALVRVIGRGLNVRPSSSPMKVVYAVCHDETEVVSQK
jgi:hypothetical protein